LICHSYYNIYSMSVTGLRFFTVYGPWGRPDMAAYKFAINIMQGKPITIFQVRCCPAWCMLCMLVTMAASRTAIACHVACPAGSCSHGDTWCLQGPEKSELKRDFTYIDDIVDGIMGALAEIPPSEKGAAHYKVPAALLLCSDALRYP
jgi:UDP-glucuronate 4-epimerase